MTALLTSRSIQPRARVESQIRHHWTCTCGTTLTDRGWYADFVRRVLAHTDACIESDLQGDA